MRNYVYSSVLFTLLLVAAGCEERQDALEPETPRPAQSTQIEPEESEEVREIDEPEANADPTSLASSDRAGKKDFVDGSKIAAIGNLEVESADKTQGGMGDGESGAAQDKKLALSGEAVEPRGAIGSGGMGFRGTDKGRGSAGFGRIGGLGKLGAGSGYTRGGVTLGSKTTGGSLVRLGSARVRGKAAYGNEGRFGPQARGTEDYQNYGTNKFTDPSKDAQSTFAIDVDTGSYTIARRKLNEGVLPPAASVRVEEFINYFGYRYPTPKDDAFAVSLEGAPSPFSAKKNRYVMRVGVQGKTLTDADRKPVHLTFLVDVSGSMSRPDKLGLAKRSLKYLTQRLKQHDTVAISTYAGNVSKVLDPTSMDHRSKIIDAIDGLNSGGSTAMNDGLQLAYQLAMKSFKPGHVNRVIVLSDGDANVGPVSHEDILKRIKSYVDEGVTLSTIGFGMGNYKDTLMEQLANQGNGNYYYIDSMNEARRIFGEQLDGTLQVIAKDVKIQVEFDPDKVSRYRLIGYENRDIADKDFRNDKIDAGEIGAGHRVTALYEVELKQPQAQKIATVRVRHKEPTADTATEREFYFGASDIAKSVGNASKDFQWATAVAGFAELLRKSPYTKQLGWDLVLEVAQASTRGKKSRKEMIGLIKKARKISG